jgi:hypothetical protein
MKSNSVEEIFIILRNNAFDLWSAVDIIFPYCFGDNEKFEIDIESKGHGPKINQEFQSKNFETGIKAAILVDFGIVRDQECFKNFDT